MTVRHLPEIERRTDERAQRIYRMTCTCGEQGEDRMSKRLATTDRAEHLMQVSDVPVAERCKMPRAHGLKPWERCGLCAGQLSLLDLEDELEDVEGAR